MADAGQESSEGISVSKPVARVMMLVNAAVWGSGYTMLKHVQENMPTQWMMFFRMASAVLLMAIVFFPRLRRIRLRRYIVPGLILALTYWLGFIFQLKGLETTSDKGLRTFSWRLNERIIICSVPRKDSARWSCISPRR